MITPHCKLSAASNNDPNIKGGTKAPSDVAFKHRLPPSLSMMEVRMNLFTATRTIKGNSRLNLKMIPTNWHSFIYCSRMLLNIVIMA